MKLTKPIEEYSTTELVRLHNELVPPTKAVTRFSTKGAGIKRVQTLLAAKAKEDKKSAAAARVSTESWSADEDASPSPATAPQAADPDAPSAKRGRKAKVPKIKAPRKSTVHVTTDGGDPVEYSSVKVAFLALGLPMGKHQGFRKKLKIEGTNVIDQHTFSTGKE